MEKSDFQVGVTVVLKDMNEDDGNIPEGRENHATAKIEVLLSDIDGGVRLDRDLYGCKYWNIDDLVIVPQQVPVIKSEFTVGTTVALKDGVDEGGVPGGRDNFATATIEILLSDIEGGVCLDRDLHGCRYWNIDDLVIVEPVVLL